jgi:hypothetical protein
LVIERRTVMLYEALGKTADIELGTPGGVVRVFP